MVATEEKGKAAPLTDVARELSLRFAERAAEYDGEDRFVERNFLDLKSAKAFSAQVPVELGGGGASVRDICEFLRTLAGGCASTALAFSMHHHLLATQVWRYKNQKAPIEPLLRKIVSEQIVLISSGGSDWLNGSGKAEKVEGGYRFSGRKIFSSGSPLGDLLMTMGVVEDGEKGRQVIHFPVSFKSPELKVLDTWRTMGMRGTGSHDIEINNFFVPDSTVAVTRAQGKWHPIMHVVVMVAIPIIYSVYLGAAESARPIALRECAKKRHNPDTQALIGEMENELTAARLAWEELVRLSSLNTPGDSLTNKIMACRTLVARSAIAAVDKAMQAVGGASFYRSVGLERIFRDVQAARYHPLPEKVQTRMSGRLALELPIDE